MRAIFWDRSYNPPEPPEDTEPVEHSQALEAAYLEGVDRLAKMFSNKGAVKESRDAGGPGAR